MRLRCAQNFAFSACGSDHMIRCYTRKIILSFNHLVMEPWPWNEELGTPLSGEKLDITGQKPAYLPENFVRERVKSHVATVAAPLRPPSPRPPCPCVPNFPGGASFGGGWAVLSTRLVAALVKTFVTDQTCSGIRMCADFWQLMHRGAPRLASKRTCCTLPRAQ